jgi:hypothetical protein
MKRVLEVLGWLTAVALFAFASHAVFAQQGQVTVTVRPPQSPEERVTDEFKEKRLRETAEEEFAKEQAAKLADKSPRALLARARTLYVRSGTSYFEPVQLQNELRKRDEFEAWGLLIFDEYKKSEVADLLIEVDRPRDGRAARLGQGHGLRRQLGRARPRAPHHQRHARGARRDARQEEVDRSRRAAHSNAPPFAPKRDFDFTPPSARRRALPARHRPRTS